MSHSNDGKGWKAGGAYAPPAFVLSFHGYNYMEFIPIKTRRLDPPQDDLLAVFAESLTDLKEGDVVIVTSKVVSIHLGLCIPDCDVDREALTRQQADGYMLNESGKMRPLTIKHHAFLYRAGIDSGNSGKYHTILPENPYEVAAKLRNHLCSSRGIKNLGLIITDSQVLPFRNGVLSVSIGLAGFVPHQPHSEDDLDLFGEPVVETSTNLADALAAGSSVVSGEADQSTPIVIARGIPNVEFTDSFNPEDFLADPKKDLFAPLLKLFRKDNR